MDKGFNRCFWWSLAILMAASFNAPDGTASDPEPAVPNGSPALASGGAQPSWLILYTGNTDGYLQSCGCGGQAATGLAQRAALLKQLRQRSPRVLLLDAGNLSSDPGKVQPVMEAMKQIGYEVVGIGPVDERVGPTHWLQAAQAGLSLVSWTLAGQRSDVQPFCVQEIGGKRFGVTSFYHLPGQIITEPLLQSWLNELAVLRQTEGPVDLVIVLSHLGRETEEQLARLDKRGIVDVIVSGTTASDEMVRVQHAYLVPTPPRGIAVGQIQVQFDPENHPWLEFSLQRPSSDLQGDPEVAGIILRYYRERQQALARESRQRPTTAPDVNKPVDADGPLSLGYVIAQRCQVCHPREYEDWKASPHAHAVTTLQKENRLVGECLRCHSELYRQKEDWLATSAARDNGVECASCHGDGILHSVLETPHSLRKEWGEKFCRTCHDLERSPNFTFETYWQRIQHRSLDQNMDRGKDVTPSVREERREVQNEAP